MAKLLQRLYLTKPTDGVCAPRDHDQRETVTREELLILFGNELRPGTAAREGV